jgi:hypothetical protein
MVNVPRAFLKWPVLPDNGDDDRMGEGAQPKHTQGANIPWLFGIPVLLLVPLTAIKAVFA